MSICFWFHRLSTVKSRGTCVLHWRLFYVSWFQPPRYISSAYSTEVGTSSARCWEGSRRSAGSFWVPELKLLHSHALLKILLELWTLESSRYLKNVLVHQFPTCNPWLHLSSWQVVHERILARCPVYRLDYGYTQTGSGFQIMECSTSEHWLWSQTAWIWISAPPLPALCL